MTTEEKIAVMQAFVDGKTIEIFDGREWKYWKDFEPLWDWSKFSYRVEVIPEYIPFDFSDAEFLIGKSIVSKDKSHFSTISFIYNKDKVTYGGNYQTFLDLFESYTFLDGSPCGKLEQ